MKTSYTNGERQLVEDNPLEFVSRIFAAKSASKGAILKRSIKSVLKFASESILIREARARGYTLYRTTTHYVIDTSPLSVIEPLC